MIRSTGFKTILFLFLVSLALILSPGASAWTITQPADSPHVFRDFIFDEIISASQLATGAVDDDEILDGSRSVELPLYSWIDDATIDIGSATSSEFVTLGIDNQTKTSSLVWASTSTTDKIYTSFAVPADYASGGVFEIFVRNANWAATNTSTMRVDYYQNSSAAAVDIVAGSASASLAAATTNYHSMKILTLSPDQDADQYAAFAANQLVGVNLYRTAGDGALHVYGIRFRYTSAR